MVGYSGGVLGPEVDGMTNPAIADLDMAGYNISSVGNLSVTGKLDVSATMAAGASQGHIIKETLAAGETYSGTTGGLTIKNYMADGTVVFNSDEFTGLAVFVKQLAAMQAGAKSSLITAHMHSSSDKVIDFGLRLFGNLDVGIQLTGGTSDYGIDMSNQTITTAGINMGNSSIVNVDGITFGDGNLDMSATATNHLSLPQNNDAATPTLSFGGTSGFFEESDGVLVWAYKGATTYGYKLSNDFIGGYGNGRAGLRGNVNASAIHPSICPYKSDGDTGIGRAGSNQLSLITGENETMRLLSSADTDSDTSDVLSTGVSGYHGFALVQSLTDDTSAIYRISNTTVVDVSLDGDHTSTKDTASHYNFYYDSDQFKLQNSVGDNKSVKVVFWCLPT